MARRKASDKQARSAPPTREQIERELDEIEESLLSGGLTEAPVTLEQLWSARKEMPAILMQRLIEGRALVPRFEFELLGLMAGSRARTYLRRIAKDEAADDLTRLVAQLRVGWPERGEAKRRLAFLDSLDDARGTLVEAINEANATWPHDGLMLEEVFGYVLVLPVERRLAFLDALGQAEQPGYARSWFLHGLLHVDDPRLQRGALEQVRRFRDRGSASPLARLAATTGDDDLRATATTASQEARAADAALVIPMPPIEDAYMSLIDGSGGQVALVALRLGPDIFAMADILINDGWGIKQALGIGPLPGDELRAIIEQMTEQGVTLVKVEPAAARGALAQGVPINAATGQLIPPAFEVWEPLFHESYPPSDDEPVIRPELDDGPYARRADLLRRSGDLANHPFFLTWGWEMDRVAAAMMAARPPAGGRLTAKQYEPMIAHLMDDQERALLRQRLRRQAWLLDQAGETSARDQALAMANHLATAPLSALAKSPFLRGLVDLSVAQYFSSILLYDLEELLLDESIPPDALGEETR